MLVSFSLPVLVVDRSILSWTVVYVVESALPAKLTCQVDRFLIKGTAEESFSSNLHNEERTASNGKVSNEILLKTFLPKVVH